MKNIIIIIFFGLLVGNNAFPVIFETLAQPMRKLLNINTKFESSIYCPICEFLINQGEEFINKYTHEEEANAYLDLACHHLPKKQQNKCENFLSENYNKIIEFINNKETAQKACNEIHACESFNNEIDECYFCKYATHQIEYFLKMNNTLSDIIMFGDSFCNSVKLKFAKQCEYVIPIYYPQIVGKIIENHNFISVCESLKLCN